MHHPISAPNDNSSSLRRGANVQTRNIIRSANTHDIAYHQHNTSYMRTFFFFYFAHISKSLGDSPACRSQREGEKKGMVNVVNNLASALYGAYFCVSSQDVWVCVCVKKYECFMLCFVYIHINIYANWVNALEGYGGMGGNVHRGNWHFIEREQQREQMRTPTPQQLGAVSDI